MIRIALILPLLFFLFNTYADESDYKTIKNTVDCKKVSARVCDLFYKDSIAVAFKEMKEYWPLPSDEIDDLQEKTIKYLNLIDERYGYKIGPVKIKDETIDTFAIKEIYLLRYEKSAIKIIFKYYDTGHGWILNGFKWDDEYSTEFK
ncbi:MAG: hypothetical protein U0T69_13395 [Chitinophagales bacterium]